MTGDKDNDTPDVPRIDKLDTLRPPSGDAYTAETVVRQAPPELIAAARAARREQLARLQGPPSVPRPEPTPPPAPIAAPPVAPPAVEEPPPSSIPIIDDQPSADGDDAETHLWSGSQPQAEENAAATAPMVELPAPRRQLDKSSPLFVMLVLVAALVAGAAVAYWLSIPHIH